MVVVVNQDLSIAITMIRACLCLLAGILAAQHNRVPLNSDHCVLLFVAAVVLLAVRYGRLAAIGLLGFLLATLTIRHEIEQRVDALFTGDSLLTTVRLIDFAVVSDRSATLRVAPLNDARLPAQLRIGWFEPPVRPKIGDVWQLELRLRRPRGAGNPGGFDLDAWMLREQIYAAGYVVNGKRNRLLASAGVNPVQRYRAAIVSRLNANIVDPARAAVLAAISVGARQGISQAQWDRYAITGTSHLMAISGLHIGLAAAAAFAVISVAAGMLRVHGNRLRYASWGAVLFALSYTIVSGSSIPAIRASVMLGLASLAFVRYRQVQPLRILAIAAVLILLCDPLAALAPGFLLSFAAVFVLLWLAQQRTQRRPKAGVLVTALTAVRQLLLMQGFLLFGLLPLTVVLFDRVAVLAPLANLLAVPLFSIVIVPAMLGAMLANPLSTRVADWLMLAAGGSLQPIEWLLQQLSLLAYADIRIASLGGIAATLLPLPLLWVLLPRGWPGRWVAPLAAAAIIVYAPPSPGRGCLAVDVLNVGQGLAVVMQTQSQSLLYDTGPSFRNGGNAAEQVVLPFLQRRGIRELHTLFVSHADNDHSGGVHSVLQGVRTRRVVTSAPEHFPGLRAERCSRGQFYQFDGVRLEVLHPDSSFVGADNDASCVLRLIAGPHSLLLTGDIEGAGERALQEFGHDLRSDIVIMPHHGSATSSGQWLVNASLPSLAIAAAGFANRWGFPKERVVRRWQGAGARVMSTSSDGAVSFKMCARTGISGPFAHRDRLRRWWQDP